MSIQLQHRVSALEAEVKALRQTLSDVLTAMAEPEPKNPNGPRQLCPKCGEKPAYHLHVVNCRGKKGASI